MKKGQTNNPFGRPPGSKNLIQAKLRKAIENHLQIKMPDILKVIAELDSKDRVKAYLELMRLVIARPLNEDEADTARVQSEMVARFFGMNKTNQDNNNND